MIRSKLNTGMIDMSEIDLLNYIELMKVSYLSIPSHRIEFHMKHGHDYITVYVDNFDDALWCANRFKKLHPNFVWTNLMGDSPVEDYANIVLNSSKFMAENTDKVILLKDILNGNLFDSLSKYVATPLNQKLYKYWLAKQSYPKV